VTIRNLSNKCIKIALNKYTELMLFLCSKLQNGDNQVRYSLCPVFVVYTFHWYGNTSVRLWKFICRCSALSSRYCRHWI